MSSPSPPRRPPDGHHAGSGRSPLTGPTAVTRPARSQRPQRRTYNTPRDPSPTSRARVRCRAPGSAQFRVRAHRVRCPSGRVIGVVSLTMTRWPYPAREDTPRRRGFAPTWQDITQRKRPYAPFHLIITSPAVPIMRSYSGNDLIASKNETNLLQAMRASKSR